MAEPVQIKNEQGTVRWTLLKYEGILWPPQFQDPVKTANDIRNFPHKDGDLFVCSQPKTGSNWMIDMLTMLRDNNTDINVAMTPPIEIVPAASFAKTPPRTLLTHLPFRFMPKTHAKESGKIILLHRNPKDTAVFTFHFVKENKRIQFKGDFEEFLQYFMSGEIMFSGFIKYFRDWDRTLKENPDLPVLIVRYEDLKGDCMCQLRRICKFLDLERSDTFLQEVVDKNTVDKVKAAKEDNPELKQLIEATSIGGTLIFYRKGLVDDWKTHFTVAQSERFDKIFSEQLKDTFIGYNTYTCRT